MTDPNGKRPYWISSHRLCFNCMAHIKMQLQPPHDKVLRAECPACGWSEDYTRDEREMRRRAIAHARFVRASGTE